MVESRLKARGRRAEMSQVLTPEEMAALFEGLREAEDGPKVFILPRTPGDHAKIPGFL